MRPILIPLALILALTGCEGEEAEAHSSPPPPVRVESLRFETLTPRADATAEIQAHRSATLRAEAAGRVVGLEIEIGQRIEEGAVIARLDVGRTNVALQAAAAGVTQADARLSQATRQRDTAARLFATGGMPQTSLDDAEDGVRLATAALEAARAQSRVTRRGLTEAVLRAPFSGTAVERLVELGEYVAPGTPIALLADTEHLKARVLLDPRRALDVERGARVIIEVHARPGERFEGRLLRVSEVVDPRTRRLPVEVEVLDPARRLRPGLVARFSVETGASREALTLDANAVFERFGLSQVYVIEEGVAHRRSVELGEIGPQRVEIVEGLEAGEAVVVAGLDRVIDGREVNVVEEVAAEVIGEAETATR